MVHAQTRHGSTVLDEQSAAPHLTGCSLTGSCSFHAVSPAVAHVTSFLRPRMGAVQFQVQFENVDDRFTQESELPTSRGLLNQRPDLSFRDTSLVCDSGN